MYSGIVFKFKINLEKFSSSFYHFYRAASRLDTGTKTLAMNGWLNHHSMKTFSCTRSHRDFLDRGGIERRKFFVYIQPISRIINDFKFLSELICWVYMKSDRLRLHWVSALCSVSIPKVDTCFSPNRKMFNDLFTHPRVGKAKSNGAGRNVWCV